MRAAHPDQTLTCFGLYSDDDAMTIVPAANSTEAVADEDGEYLWNISEWQFEDSDEYLDPAYRMILPPHRDIPCNVDIDFSEIIFESCVDALSKLRDEGFFGEPNDDLIVLFQVSDSDYGVKLNKRLNGYQFNAGHLENPSPQPSPTRGEGARDFAFGSGSPLPAWERGWG